MLNQERGPYRLTLEEFESLPVSALQLERREAIRDLAAALFTVDLTGTGHERITAEHPSAQPINHFTKGIYAREFRMAAGMRIVGLRHKQEHISVISQGRATVMTEHGRQELKAPCTFVSPAGTQRFLLIHEDMVWTTIHRTDEEEMDAIMADLAMDESSIMEPKIKALEVHP